MLCARRCLSCGVVSLSFDLRSLPLQVARWFLGEVLRLPLFQTNNKPGEDEEVDKGTVVVLTRSCINLRRNVEI